MPKLSKEQLKLKFSLENVMSGEYWTPQTLSRLNHVCFANVSGHTIRESWMKNGKTIDGEIVKLRYARSSGYVTRKDWVVEFLLKINPHLSDASSTSCPPT